MERQNMHVCVCVCVYTGWGMVNSSTHYTPVTGVGQDYTWALTSNPWGYLSRDTHVSGERLSIYVFVLFEL